MFHRLALCMAALLAVSLTSVASAQQQASFKPEFRPGQDLIYPLAMRQAVANEIEDQGSDQWLLVCSATMVMRIETVESDGSITATCTFKRGAVRLTEADTRLGYAWGSDARDDPEWGVVAQLSRPLSTTKCAISVDPKGKVTFTSGLEEFAAKYAEIALDDERLLGFFTPELLAAAISPIFALDGASRDPVTVGKQWQETSFVPVTGAGVARVAMDISVQRIDTAEAEYFGLPRVEFSPAPRTDPDAAEVSLIDSGGGISGIFDLKTRMLSQRKHTLMIKTRWVGPKQTIIQTQNTTMYLQLGEAKR